TFAAVFYRRLLAHGRVDLAANEARSAVHTARLPGPSIPVLYARVPDGQLLAAREANEADSRQSPADLALSGAERAYLRTLQRDCNRLPLAEEMRETQTRRKERAQLANVYVDLQVDVSPNLEQV